MVLRPKTRESRSPPGLTRSRIKRILLRYLSVPLDAGWSSPVARQAHNLKVRGSNPLPATTDRNAASLGTGSSVSSRNPPEPGRPDGCGRARSPAQTGLGCLPKACDLQILPRVSQAIEHQDGVSCSDDPSRFRALADGETPGGYSWRKGNWGGGETG